MQLVYVFDAYCGWCHGFAPTLREVVRRHPELPIEVISGGLFTGSRRVPIGRFGYIDGANARISELTGAVFGPGYRRLIADGSFVMDSEAAARGFAALRDAAPDRAVELAEAVQHAFYVEGRSLSDPDTFTAIAAQRGLTLGGPVAAGEEQADFVRTKHLGVTGFPTLLAVHGSSAVVLAHGQGDADVISSRLDALVAGGAA
ncbi:DsbA family protein [Actinoplanes sp. OR16]|uniref:DsbA family protein n=1 Tax=Actinoplanes sp. OR16 TaxID=946334 RepID=UPI000F6CA2E7|nr:DsbA family protein [Actinoplanes sp. OR16]BBH69756.1 DsbA family protein [Actinoplanes sp. OR16]